jgi:hypothetical protein
MKLSGEADPETRLEPLANDLMLSRAHREALSTNSREAAAKGLTVGPPHPRLIL